MKEAHNDNIFHNKNFKIFQAQCYKLSPDVQYQQTQGKDKILAYNKQYQIIGKFDEISGKGEVFPKPTETYDMYFENKMDKVTKLIEQLEKLIEQLEKLTGKKVNLKENIDQQILDLYQSGKFQSEIADILNVPFDLVTKLTNHLGMTVGNDKDTDERFGDDPSSKQYYDRTLGESQENDSGISIEGGVFRIVDRAKAEQIARNIILNKTKKVPGYADASEHPNLSSPGGYRLNFLWAQFGFTAQEIMKTFGNSNYDIYQKFQNPLMNLIKSVVKKMEAAGEIRKLSKDELPTNFRRNYATYEILKESHKCHCGGSCCTDKK